MAFFRRYLVVLLAFAVCNVALAQEPEAEPAIDHLRTLTQQVTALSEGTLDPSVDPNALFDLDLEDVRELASSGTRVLEEEAQQKLTPLEAVQHALSQARWAFISLPEERKAELLTAHSEKAEQAKAEALKIEALSKEIDAVSLKTAHWRAFLEGTLDAGIDPHSLTKVELLSGDFARLALSNLAGEQGETVEDNKEEVEAANTDTPEASELSKIDALQIELETKREQLDVERRAFLALTPAERAALFDQHNKRKEEETPDDAAPLDALVDRAEAVAESVAQERDAALDASKNAETEVMRLLSDEQAALLDVKHSQAELSIDLAEKKQHVVAIRETALTWDRRVRELSDRTELVGNTEGHADALYEQLTVALHKTRNELRKNLQQIATHDTAVPAPKAAPKVPGHIDTTELEALRIELSEQALSLQIQREDAWWEQAQVSRDAMVLMNEARLTLLGHLSSSKRGNLHGFGKHGTQQASRELDEITLEGRFHLLNLPRFARSKIAQFRESPTSLLFSLLKLIMLVIAFRWWRSRADKWLGDLRLRFLRARPRTMFTRSTARVVWYLQQVRVPLEWLVILSLLVNVVTDLGDIPEIGYVWIVILWTLLGSLVVLFVNALVARSTGMSSDGSLRLRSLRTIGVCVIVVGLALSIARSSVGKGTIYTWVLKTCWVLAIPITFMLVYWWRPTVIARAKATANPNRLVAWVAQNDTGLKSFIGSAIGGGYLLTEGIKRAAIQQAGNFSVMQGFLAYLLRRQVEKQGIVAGEDARYAPLDAEACEAITTEFREDAPTVPISNEQVEHVRQLVAKDGNTTIAVAGERGLGKTTFMNRVMGTLDADCTIHLSCGPGGFAALLSQLAVACDIAPDSTEEEVLIALQQGTTELVAIDDVQRLTRPLIGGLRDIDRLVALARSTGGNTSWIMAIDMPAWQYFKRARGDRAIFDETVVLRRWTESEIGELVRLRSKVANFDPLFDELILPAQFDVDDVGGKERHTQQNYARILWDYSSGNPAVALRFFEESLGVRDEKVYVRLFRAPALSELADLPASMYFVLRSVLQLSQAVENDVVLCTDLNAADVSDALRAALKRKYIVADGGNLRISLYWYRAIVQVLQRHHLVPEAL